MVITDEILAAYVDGTLPQEQVEEVRQYLATHPQEMEDMVKLMDKNPIIMRESKKKSLVNVSIRRANAASFIAPPTEKRTKRNSNIMNNIDSLFDQIF